MDIVCATDGNYLPHCVAMLQSLWERNKRSDLRVYLITDNADSKDLGIALTHLHRLLPSISFLQANPEPLQGFPVNGHATVATYFRLLLPVLLPGGLDKVIFIDSDTIITDSLDDLWKTPLNGKALAAVPEHRLSCKDHGYQHGGYFNAGIMKVDLQRWRGSGLLERGRAFASQYPERLRHWDQDVLNHVFADDWVALGDRWNACPHLFGLTPGYSLEFDDLNSDERVAIKSPAIVHFAGPGPVKPWNARCNHPLKQSYLDAKAKTPWAATELLDIPPPRWKQVWQQTVFKAKCMIRHQLVRNP
ncbi:MAG: glycosyltransferase family 8 protein [Cyanobacteria bacterium]|nr:glycosyltransferase family 8 protein [Cyanobacteriota bacterium]